MSELKKLTKEEVISRAKDSLNFWESDNYQDHGEINVAENIEYWKMIIDALEGNPRTASPRFTEGEREALKTFVTYAIDGYRKSRTLPTSYTQASEYAVRDKEFEKQLATVRQMLEGSV